MSQKDQNLLTLCLSPPASSAMSAKSDDNDALAGAAGTAAAGDDFDGLQLRPGCFYLFRYALPQPEEHSTSEACLASLRDPARSRVPVAVVAAPAPTGKKKHDEEAFLDTTQFVAAVREVSAQLFTIVFAPELVSPHAKRRLACFERGARMIANDREAVLEAMRLVFSQFPEAPDSSSRPQELAVVACPVCGLNRLSEDRLHLHFPLYHGAEHVPRTDCVLCDRTADSYRAFAVHLHNEHGRPEFHEPPAPDFPAFAWVCIQRPSDGKFLLVHEPAGIAGGRPAFWFPAGRVDEGETLVEAGVREAEEEAGIRVDITGLLLVMIDGGVVPRVMLYAVPSEGEQENTGKSLPDFESCGAAWLDLEQIDSLDPVADFRGADTAQLYRAVSDGRLSPLPLETASFQAFEKLVRDLTSEKASGGRRSDSHDRWARKLKKISVLLANDYPAERQDLGHFVGDPYQ